jgi:hypothetical protein
LTGSWAGGGATCEAARGSGTARAALSFSRLACFLCRRDSIGLSSSLEGAVAPESATAARAEALAGFVADSTFEVGGCAAPAGGFAALDADPAAGTAAAGEPGVAAAVGEAGGAGAGEAGGAAATGEAGIATAAGEADGAGAGEAGAAAAGEADGAGAGEAGAAAAGEAGGTGAGEAGAAAASEADGAGAGEAGAAAAGEAGGASGVSLEFAETVSAGTTGVPPLRRRFSASADVLPVTSPGAVVGLRFARTKGLVNRPDIRPSTSAKTRPMTATPTRAIADALNAQLREGVAVVSSARTGLCESMSRSTAGAVSARSTRVGDRNDPASGRAVRAAGRTGWGALMSLSSLASASSGPGWGAPSAPDPRAPWLPLASLAGRKLSIRSSSSAECAWSRPLPSPLVDAARGGRLGEGHAH